MPSEPRVLTWGAPSVLLVLGALSLGEAALIRARFIELLGDASCQAGLVGIDLESRIRFVLLREAVLLSGALVVGVAVHLWIEKPMLRLLRRAALSPGRGIVARPPVSAFQRGRPGGGAVE